MLGRRKQLFYSFSKGKTQTKSTLNPTNTQRTLMTKNEVIRGHGLSISEEINSTPDHLI